MKSPFANSSLRNRLTVGVLVLSAIGFIGAGVGALGGVLIDKNNARGAIIGGLAGAGAGYAIGRAEDRKSGRVQKKQ